MPLLAEVLTVSTSRISAERRSMKLKIAILAGDGIGPEVTREAVSRPHRRRRIRRPPLHFRFTEALLGGVAITAAGTPLPQATLDARPRSPTPSSSAPSATTNSTHLTPDKRPEAGLLNIRQALGGFANLRPSVAYTELERLLPAPPRQSSQRRRHPLRPRAPRRPLLRHARAAWNQATPTKRHQHHASTPATEVLRVARIAFDLAGKRRGKLTSVDKANVLETSQLWRATVTEVAKDYPAVTLEHQLVDSMAMHIMNRPRELRRRPHRKPLRRHPLRRSGVITGSLGMLPSATIGGAVNLYEPVHGSAPRHRRHRQG